MPVMIRSVPKAFLSLRYSTYTQHSVYNCLVNVPVFNFADFPVQSLTKIRTSFPCPFLVSSLLQYRYKETTKTKKSTPAPPPQKKRRSKKQQQQKTNKKTTPPLEEIGLFSYNIYASALCLSLSVCLSLSLICTRTHTHYTYRWQQQGRAARE